MTRIRKPNRKKITILVGPTGCGKTTYRRWRYGLALCISPDDFIVGKWTGRKCTSAWMHALATYVEMLKTGELDIVVDAQFVNAQDRREWVSLARAFGYAVDGIIFSTPWRRILANQRARGDRNGYGLIPKKVLVRSYRLFTEQLKSGLIDADFDSVTIVPWKKRGNHETLQRRLRRHAQALE